MNQKQRKQWEQALELLTIAGDSTAFNIEILIAANAYILKLERELQNIKGHKRIAKILLPKQDTV